MGAAGNEELPVARKQRELLKIGAVVKRTGFTRQQIHNFLVMGLIKEDSRTAAGHRLFGVGVFKRLAIIRGLLAQNYPLAEIRRTWKAFGRLVLICFLLIPAGSIAAARARAAERPRAVSQEDLAAIRALFKDLRKMMLDGDSGMIAGLMDPKIKQERLHHMIERLDDHFESISYTAFSGRFQERTDVEVLGKDQVRVHARLRYEYHEQSQDSVSNDDDQYWYFELVRTPGGWRITDATWFDTLSSTRDAILGRIFTIAAILIIVGSFWGWMFLDCCFRNWGGRKLPWVASLGISFLAGVAALIACFGTRADWLMAVALAPGLVALVYFFAIWMRQGAED